MQRSWANATSDQLRHLRRLTVALGDALTVDDVARAALNTAMRMPGVIRAALALSQGAGRELRFVATDQDALTPGGVRWCTIDGFAEVPVVRAVRDGSETYLQTYRDLQETYPDIAERQWQLGTRSMVSVPLVSEDDRVGALMLSFKTERYFSHDDRWLISSFATQVTQAIRRGMAYQIQHSTSEQLQRSLMPHSLPDVDGLGIGTYYQSGGKNVDVGGDWYDVLELSDGSVAVSLGDVMGKGVPAAIVMSEVRSAMRAYALLDPTPSLVLSRLDNLVNSLAVAEQIVTAVYGVFSPDRSQFEYAVAGHPPPLLIPPSGEPVVLDESIGPALGIGIGPWPKNHLDLEAGSSLLLYSDGLVEARDVDLFTGVEQLVKHVADMAPRRRNPRELVARLSGLMYQENINDDVTLLAASVTGSRAVLNASLELPADTSASGRARRFLRDTLTSWELDPDLLDTAELCVSELVTNSIIHSGTSPEVSLRMDDEVLLVLVQDRGGEGTVARDKNYDPMAVSGRGLTLIDALASAWSAEHSADGTTVWFELELVPATREHAHTG